ncbi:MAG: (2Fe-2S)-binding protein [Nannocystaceae bacterium]
MDADERLLARPATARAAVSVRWDRDRVLTARRGDTVSLALLDEGILETSRSAKYRRPRGAYCLQGDCGTCLVRIDGLPNRRACLTAVREGIRVEPQNRLLSGPDPSALIDTMMRGGMDHHHFMVKPRVVNQIMQGVARNLTGLGTLPDHGPDEPARHEVHRPEVLIVGAGAAGRAAQAVLAAAGREVLWVDRRDREGLAGSGEPLPSSLLVHTGVFGVYRQERLWAAVTDAPGRAEVLLSIVPQHVIVATGARDPMIALPDNDRPGVVAARGLLRQLQRSDARVREDEAVVVGDGDHAASLAAALGVEQVATDRVERIEGSPVEQLRLRDGRRQCRLVALAAPPAPAYELARQAGAAVRWRDGGFAVQRDDDGRCTAKPWTVWAAGDVAGYMGPTAAADDGERVARALLRHPSIRPGASRSPSR